MANVKGGIIAKTQNKAVAEAKAPTTIKGAIIAMKDQIAKALPAVITPERFTRMVLTALSTNPQLQMCTTNSFMGAMMQAAQLGVEPNTPLGQAYLIPYKNKGQLECQFQLGYRGLIELAYRGGDVTDIQAHEVYENDIFEYEYGLHPNLIHKPALSNRGNVVLYYAVFHTKSGGFGFYVMSKEDIQNHAKKYSQAAKSQYSPWTTNFDSMAKKTVLKQCLKFAPIKTDFIRGIAADETIKSEIREDMVDVNDETVIDTEAEEVVEDDTAVAPAEPVAEEEIPMDDIPLSHQ